jgi:hypothetical protein
MSPMFRSIKLSEKPREAGTSQNNHLDIAKKASMYAMSRERLINGPYTCAPGRTNWETMALFDNELREIDDYFSQFPDYRCLRSNSLFDLRLISSF